MMFRIEFLAHPLALLPLVSADLMIDKLIDVIVWSISKTLLIFKCFFSELSGFHSMMIRATVLAHLVLFTPGSILLVTDEFVATRGTLKVFFTCGNTVRYSKQTCKIL